MNTPAIAIAALPTINNTIAVHLRTVNDINKPIISLVVGFYKETLFDTGGNEFFTNQYVQLSDGEVICLNSPNTIDKCKLWTFDIKTIDTISSVEWEEMESFVKELGFDDSFHVVHSELLKLGFIITVDDKDEDFD